MYFLAHSHYKLSLIQLTTLRDLIGAHIVSEGLSAKQGLAQLSALSSKLLG